MMGLKELLSEATKQKASDLHITSGSAPALRINGEMYFLKYEPLNASETKRLIYDILSEEQKAKFEDKLELDFSLSFPAIGRFRANIYQQRGSVEASFRVVSHRIRSIKELGLPDVVAKLAMYPDGLVIITGPVGMGKTTTMAAMVDLINREKRYRIITIEDPIEYVHDNINSVIIQREVHSDTYSFTSALSHSFRQDPNVLCIGEMRDLETISITLTAAETGHLVLATLHTPDAPQTIDRIVDVFPPHQQQQIRVQLAATLRGVVAQQLLPRFDGDGRVVATEILLANPAVRNLIREAKTSQIPSVIQTGAEQGMHLMDASIKELYAKGIISYDSAVSRARDPQELIRSLT